MREKLAELGVGTEITVLGQYNRRSGQNLLFTNLYKLYDGEYLCDHAWIDKGHSSATTGRRKSDIIVFKGTIYEYNKGRYETEIDYSLYKIHDVIMLKPFMFNDKLVFINYNECNNYWFFRLDTENCKDEIFNYYDILKLYTDNTEQRYDFDKHEWVTVSNVGYHIENETDEYYELYYEKRDSRIKIYKTLKDAVKHTIEKEN